MARWKIEPLGVKGVVVKAEGHATSLSTAVSSFGTDLENCAQAIGASIVTKALSDFGQARSAELKGVGTRITTAMNGTVQAVNAYITGNLEMAKNAQHQAAQVVPPTHVPAGGPGRMRVN